MGVSFTVNYTCYCYQVLEQGYVVFTTCICGALSSAPVVRVMVLARSAAKLERQKQLQRILQRDPFVTDETLAKILNVSVQTVRLDRLELGIPELRERTKSLAETTHAQIRSLSGKEVIGELTEVELERFGTSILVTNEDMGFAKTGIVRGHVVFAQGNSLAVALVDAPVALTAKAEVRFLRPVYVGDRVFARAEVVSGSNGRFEVRVESRVDDQVVFQGDFFVVGLDAPPKRGGNSDGR